MCDCCLTTLASVCHNETISVLLNVGVIGRLPDNILECSDRTLGQNYEKSNMKNYKAVCFWSF